MEETNKEQTNAQPTQDFTAQEAANKTEPVATKQPRVKWSSLKKLKVACAALAIGLALSLGGNIALVTGNLNKPADMRHDVRMEQSFAPGDCDGSNAQHPNMPDAPEEGEMPDADTDDRVDPKDKSGKSDESKDAAGNEQEKPSESQSEKTTA